MPVDDELDDEQPVDFEVLPGGRTAAEVERARPARPRRVRVDLVIAAAALVAAALIGRALTNHTKSPHAPAPTSSTTKLVHPSLPTGSSELIPLRNTGNLAACARADDGLSLCTSRTRVSSTVLAAITSRFAGAATRQVFDEQLRDVGYGSGGIWYRHIVAVSGSLHIDVEIHRLRDTDVASIGSRTAAGRSVVTAVHLTPVVAVHVTVTGTASRPADLGAVRDLAADSRLLV